MSGELSISAIVVFKKPSGVKPRKTKKACFVRRILQLASVFLIRQLSARNDENHYRSLTYVKKQWKDLVVK